MQMIQTHVAVKRPAIASDGMMTPRSHGVLTVTDLRGAVTLKMSRASILVACRIFVRDQGGSNALTGLPSASFGFTLAGPLGAASDIPSSERSQGRSFFFR
jgi:hypothetical protein